MIVLSGADVILPDRVLNPGTVIIDGNSIVDVLAGTRSGSPADEWLDLSNHCIVPGFVDVHIHGVDGIDSLDGADAVGRIARKLPRYGVTAFCPTSVACSPRDLRQILADVRHARTTRAADAARVLPAHLESNFINPDFRGAQPAPCLRLPHEQREGDFSGAEILHEIAVARADVGIVTVAPELAGVLDVIRDLVAHGHRVSLGHSGASYEEALAGIEAGARHATHLFNRMTPLNHRAPGLAGAVLDHEAVTAEVICDGVHVHPAAVRVALAAKSAERIVAITDATAGAGLPHGSRTVLGGRPITVREAAYLDDGTLAGSVRTMDRAFAMLVRRADINIVAAARICSTTPARVLKLDDVGLIRAGARADLAVLDGNLRVRRTFIDGHLAWAAGD